MTVNPATGHCKVSFSLLMRLLVIHKWMPHRSTACSINTHSLKIQITTATCCLIETICHEIQVLLQTLCPLTLGGKKVKQNSQHTRELKWKFKNSYWNFKTMHTTRRVSHNHPVKDNKGYTTKYTHVKCISPNSKPQNESCRQHNPLN